MRDGKVLMGIGYWGLGVKEMAMGDAEWRSEGGIGSGGLVGDWLCGGFERRRDSVPRADVVGYGHGAAMFLGVPAVLAILLALTPKAKTVTGGILKGITLALLIVAPLVGEGYLCILMASPLFYAVGLVVGRLADWKRQKRAGTVCCVASCCCRCVWRECFRRPRSIAGRRWRRRGW